MTNEFNNLLEEDLAGRSLQVGQVVDGTVVQISEDGVFVDIGAKSEGHLELDQIVQEELARLQVGDPLKVRIIKKVDGEYKLSKKSVDYEIAWNKLQEDRDNSREVEVKVVEKVKNGYMAEAYGLLQGFIHHTNFKGKPALGQMYKAQILDMNRKARKLVFTRRDIMKREEDEALTRDFSVLQEGMVVEGVVDKLSPYGAFIKITEHLTGLLHISEFSFEHVKKPSEVLKPGDVVQVKILHIDREKNKISLSRKATMSDPLTTLFAGEELEGRVESLTDFGMFIRLNNGVTGLVHVSELSYRKFNHPSELYKPHDVIRVKVLRVQPEERRVSLSAKACERDPWEEVYSRYTPGQSVSGAVMQMMQSGLVLKLDDFFEAFVPISELSEERIKHPSDVVKDGDTVQGTVLSVDTAKRRIRVSLRRTSETAQDTPSAKQSDYIQTDDHLALAGKVTLGDILGSKLDLTAVTRREREHKDDQPEVEPVAEDVTGFQLMEESAVEQLESEPESSTEPAADIPPAAEPNEPDSAEVAAAAESDENAEGTVAEVVDEETAKPE